MGDLVVYCPNRPPTDLIDVDGFGWLENMTIYERSDVEGTHTVGWPYPPDGAVPPQLRYVPEFPEAAESAKDFDDRLQTQLDDELAEEAEAESEPEAEEEPSESPVDESQDAVEEDEEVEAQT